MTYLVSAVKKITRCKNNKNTITSKQHQIDNDDDDDLDEDDDGDRKTLKQNSTKCSHFMYLSALYQIQNELLINIKC